MAPGSDHESCTLTSQVASHWSCVCANARGLGAARSALATTASDGKAAAAAARDWASSARPSASSARSSGRRSERSAAPSADAAPGTSDALSLHARRWMRRSATVTLPSAVISWRRRAERSTSITCSWVRAGVPCPTRSAADRRWASRLSTAECTASAALRARLHSCHAVRDSNSTCASAAARSHRRASWRASAASETRHARSRMSVMGSVSVTRPAN